jgi:hypothetical protein
MRDKIIYSMTLANYLMSKGFRMNEVQKNTKLNHMIVFFFAKVEGIEKAITDFNN